MISCPDLQADQHNATQMPQLPCSHQTKKYNKIKNKQLISSAFENHFKYLQAIAYSNRFPLRSMLYGTFVGSLLMIRCCSGFLSFSVSLSLSLMLVSLLHNSLWLVFCPIYRAIFIHIVWIRREPIIPYVLVQTPACMLHTNSSHARTHTLTHSCAFTHEYTHTHTHERISSEWAKSHWRWKNKLCVKLLSMCEYAIVFRLCLYARYTQHCNPHHITPTRSVVEEKSVVSMALV